jgi:hypothetical protein
LSIELNCVCEKGREGHHGREKVSEGHRRHQTIEKKMPQIKLTTSQFFSEVLY